jgi:(2R)-sulfolactate sulfo-lyase subunit beta
MKSTFLGYRRPDGKVGIRNHVAILPLDDLSNAAATAVGHLIQGTLPLPHPYGRLQFGRDLRLFFDTLIGTGRNPNLAAVVVIGIEPNWTRKVAEGIAETGKPVAWFAIERCGDLTTIEKASRKAKEFVQAAGEIRREEVPLSELVVSIKCGESDTTSGLAANPTVGRVVERLLAAGGTVIFGETTELTGGEDIVAARMKTPEARARFQKVFDDYARLIETEGADLLGSQPTQGNIIGGLTTIEEKALGNIQKIGRARVDGVLAKAEPVPGRGLWFMDSSSAAADAVTRYGAGGHPSLSDRSGQYHRQSRYPGDQAVGESFNGEHDVRAYRRRRHRNPGADEDFGSGGRRPSGYADPNGERPSFFGRSPRPQGIRSDEAVRKRVRRG